MTRESAPFRTEPHIFRSAWILVHSTENEVVQRLIFSSDTSKEDQRLEIAVK